MSPNLENEGGKFEKFYLVATFSANAGYGKEMEVLTGVCSVFRNDKGFWDAVKDIPGAGVNKRTRLGYAAMTRNLERVVFLLERGAKVNLGEATGKTALMWASEKGHLEIVRELCVRGANLNAAMTDDGFTSLMWAIQTGHLEIVRELCVRGGQCECCYD